MEKTHPVPIPSFICGPNIMTIGQHPIKRMNPINPNKEDPRPPPPCIKNPCCSCRPLDLPLAGPCYDMKLKQLADCYRCQVSDACRRRRTNFYGRWQQHMDKLIPIPGYDYKIYCCDNYLDLSPNKDFIRYSYYKPNYKGQRLKAKLNFMFTHSLSDSLGVEENIRSVCAPSTNCDVQCTVANTCEDRRSQMDKQVRLYQEEPYTHWHQHMLRPKPIGFINGSTLIKSRTKPFHKNTNFSTPLQQFSTGNNPPFKEFRDIKLNM